MNFFRNTSLFIIAALMVSGSALAQSRKVDSLRNKLNFHRQEDTTKLRLCYNIAWQQYIEGGYEDSREQANSGIVLSEKLMQLPAIKDNKDHVKRCYLFKALFTYTIALTYVKQSDYPKAIEYDSAALRIYSVYRDLRGMASCYNALGTIALRQSNYPEARKNYLITLKLCEENKDKKGLAASYTNLGSVFYNEGKYQEAIKYYFMGIKANEDIEVNDKRGAITCYLNIANVYETLGDRKAALVNDSIGLEISRKLGDEGNLASAYSLRGMIYYNDGNLKKALVNQEEALKIWIKIGAKLEMASSYSMIGDVLQDLGHREEAMKNYMEGLKLMEEINSPKGIAEGCQCIGMAYVNMGKYEEGLTWLTRSLKIGEEVKSPQITLKALEGLYKLYDKKGDYKLALENYQLYSKAKDSLFNEESNKNINLMKTQFETEKKEKELATLKIANELQVQKTKQRNAYILLISALSLLVFALLWFQSYRRKKKLVIREKEIEKKDLELKNKDLLIEKKKTEERAKVQKEISQQYHDILGSKITSLMFMCENEKMEKETRYNGHEFASRVSQKLRDIAETNRSGIIALDPDTQDLNSFIAKLRSDLYDLTDTAGKEINFNIPNELPGLKIEPIVKFNLSALMKEAINNSIKYSGTKEIHLQVEMHGTHYTISVMDHGVGINPAKIKNHSYGLLNMKNRMHLIGGECEIISELNKGTTVKLSGDFTFVSQMN